MLRIVTSTLYALNYALDAAGKLFFPQDRLLRS